MIRVSRAVHAALPVRFTPDLPRLSRRTSRAFHAGPPALFTPDLPCFSRRTSRAFHAGPPALFTPDFPRFSRRTSRAFFVGPRCSWCRTSDYLPMTFVSALCPLASWTTIWCAPRVSGQRKVSSRPPVPIEAPLTNHSSAPRPPWARSGRVWNWVRKRRSESRSLLPVAGSRRSDRRSGRRRGLTGRAEERTPAK